MIDDIRVALENAKGSRRKTAMFHYQVLKNAQALEGIDPTLFCKEVGMRATFATEFRKMISLARLMREDGARIVSF